MSEEMKEMRKSNEKVVRTLERIEGLEERVVQVEADAKQAKAENEILHKIVTNQQVFLEQMDARERQLNAVITGLGEDDESLGQDDRAKMITILNAIECTVGIDSIQYKRIGQEIHGRIRPILATFQSKGNRDDALSKAKTLKTIQGPNQDKFRKIYT